MNKSQSACIYIKFFPLNVFYAYSRITGNKHASSRFEMRVGLRAQIRQRDIKLARARLLRFRRAKQKLIVARALERKPHKLLRNSRHAGPAPFLSLDNRIKQSSPVRPSADIVSILFAPGPWILKGAGLKLLIVPRGEVNKLVRTAPHPLDIIKLIFRLR
jgi:hypothetical protein